VATTELPDLIGYSRNRAHLTRHQIERLLATGNYERIAPGLFLRTGATDDTTAAWMAIAARKPTATLCLLTALSLHDLTDQIATRSDIALPRGTHPVKVRFASIAWHTFGADTFTIGRDTHPLPGSMSIGLYSPERTIVDLFRLRHEHGADLATGALKRWLRVRGNSPSRLLAVAAKFPDADPSLRHTLEIIL
jgi:predicted transcriptional regulator of viral defense system